MTTDNRLKHVLLAACGAAAIGTAASAQGPGPLPDKSGTTLDTVIVTAQRREQNLQDVPISVTALSGQQLEIKQITDVSNLTRVTPGLTVAQAFVPNDVRIGIRGITELLPTITTDTAIGVYIDGVYYAANPGSNLAMMDMERAEVLKGPQGTLFGRNTIGGALNIVTKQPTDKLEGFVEGEVGNIESWGVTGLINIPLNDRWATRFVAEHTQHDGYGTNTFLHQPIGDQDQNYFRGTIRGELSDNWDISVAGFYADMKGHPTPSKIKYVVPGSNFDTLIPTLNGRPGDKLSNYLGGGFYDNQGDVNPKVSMRVYGNTDTIVGHFEGFTVKSITGLTHTYYNPGDDTDGTPYPALQILSFPYNRDTASEELQVYGKALDDRLDWIAGVYYFTDRGSAFYHTAALKPAAGGLTYSGGAIKNTSQAAFAQATFEIVPRLRLTGGVRYTRDTRKITYHDAQLSYTTETFLRCTLANAPGATDPNLCFLDRSATFDYVPWTVGVDYRANADVLLYAKVAKGYRSGAYALSGPQQQPTAAGNAALLAAFQAVAPEDVFSPEAGVKMDLLDRTLRINVGSPGTELEFAL